MDSLVSTIGADHPTRSGFGLEVHPEMPEDGCRVKYPEATLLSTRFHVLLLCEVGSPTQMINHQEVHYRPGVVVWIPPGVVHERVPYFEGVDLCFTSAFLGSDLAGRVAGGFWSLQGETLAVVRSMFALMGWEYGRYLTSPTGARLQQDEMVMRHQLLALVTRLQSEPGVGFAHETAHPLVDDFLRLVVDQCGQMRDVEDYARALGCSDRTLRRLCLEQLGVTPGQIINRQLVSAAENLLTTTDRPLATVARMLGFFDSASFSRFFKRATGLTPGAFRNKTA